MATNAGRKHSWRELLLVTAIMAGCTEAVEPDTSGSDDGGDERDAGAADATPDDTIDAAPDDASNVPFDDGSSSLDAGDPVTDPGTCLPGTLAYAGMVVDATTPTQTVPGITVEVLDDETGLPLRPPVTGVSTSDGRITLIIDRCRPFAVKARGNSNYIDTYTYHLQPAASGRPEALIRMGGNNAAALLPALAEYPVMLDRAPVAGAVYWKTPDMAFYDAVGCAQIESPNGVIPEDWALRYYMAAVPSSPAEWPLSRGTRKNDGRFFLGNAAPGIHTLIARVNGERVGATDVVIFPRTQGSTSVSGSPEHLILAGIYIDAPAGAVHPTTGSCQQ